MPDYTSAASTIRSRANYRAPVWACTVPQTVVLTGTLTATPSFPVTTLAYTVTTGTYSAVQDDQRVRFFSSTGTFKGETRIRFKSSGVTSTSLPIAETSANTINFVSGDTFTVYEQWNIQDRLVSATSDFNKDTLIAVSDYGTNMPPVANGGGLRAGFFDAGHAYTTHQHDASTSYVVDPDSSTFTPLWDVGDGTIVSGSTTTNAITVQYPAGFRWIKLTITDSGNGKSTVKRIPVWSFDPAGALPMRVTDLSLNSAVKDGWSGEIEIARESAPTLANLPDGALIVLFETAYYGTTQASYRSAMTGGSNILAVLFLESETIDFQPGSGAVTFRAEGPLAVLKRTPALPQLMISGSTADWQHVKELTINRALWYLAFWHATVMEVFDFVWVTTGTDLHYQRIAVENIDSIAGQLADVSTSILADPTCDALGRILIIRDPNYLSSSDRSALVTTWNLTVADITSLSMDRLHHGSVKHVRGEGVTNGNAAYFSNAGNAPSPIGIGSETLSRQIVVTQSELNTRTGKHFARINGLYNGQFVPQGVTVDVPDGYAIFDPAYREWVTLALASSTNDRAVAFTTATRWTVDAISISFDGDTGGRDVEITISHETDGADGVTYVPPADNTGDVNTPGDDWPIQPYVPPGGDLPAVNLYQGTQRIAVPCANGLALTTNFGSGDLTTWAYATWASLSISGTILQFVPNGFDPGSGWLVTSTDVYYLALATGTATGKHTFGASSLARSADASFGTANHFVVCSYYSASGVKALYTTDNSAFTEVTVASGHITSGSAAPLPGCYVSPKTAGLVYCTAFTANGAVGVGSPPGSAYRSADYGASWATTSNPDMSGADVRLAQHIHVPYADSETTAFFNNGASYPNSALYRSRGGSAVNVAPTIGGTAYTLTYSRQVMETYVGNANRALACLQKSNGLATDFAVFRSDNAMAASPAWIVIDGNGSVYRRCAIAGDNPDVFYLLGASASVALVTDAVTIADQSGNLASFSPGDVLAIAGY